MIIQTTPHITQAVQPGAHAPGAAPAQPVAAAPAPSVPAQVSTKELSVAVETINKALQQSNLNLQFSVDNSSQRTVVKMMDTSTGELIRQFPTEATLAISREIEQFQKGLLLTQEA